VFSPILESWLSRSFASFLLGLVNEPKCVFVSHVSGLYSVAFPLEFAAPSSFVLLILLQHGGEIVLPQICIAIIVLMTLLLGKVDVASPGAQGRKGRILSGCLDYCW